MDFPISEITAARALLLDPTPENLSSAGSKLEAVASFLIAAKQSLETGQKGDHSLPVFLTELKGEMARIRSLLTGAAAFFNGLNGLDHASIYQRSGFLATETRRNRTLGQL
jgi:hypothetical protein